MLDPDRRYRLLVVDDHDVVHWGLRMVLSTQPWVGRYLKASSSTDAFQLAERYNPHVALIDLFVGRESGAEICAELVAQHPRVRVLLFSGSGKMSAAAARAAGASGFISKDSPARDVASAVATVCAGRELFTGGSEQVLSGLSPRELEILELIARGATNREIAAELHLSAHTVKDYTGSLYSKVKARNRAEAVLLAQRAGLIA
jgi:DNA-binding NarL/FixJ family response regulator